MTERKQGFEYIDLRESDIKKGFRPRPASKHLEVYVVRNSSDEDELEVVYRLITRKSPVSGRQVFSIRKSDGKYLVMRITKGDIFDSMSKYYELR